MNKIIDPIILKGTRDFLPLEMLRRNFVMGVIQKTFEQFGYSPIETPILCPAETILGKYGEEGDRLTYAFEDKGGRRIALPYDLTVPFARYVAANYPDLPIPFKRYQIQRVWRAEKPQKGRLREFYQCDIDIIGTKSLIAEAEIAKVIVEVFTKIGINNFVIKVNSRRLMNAILESFEIPEEKRIPVIRIIDKLAKIGQEAVIEELQKIEIENAQKILEILNVGVSNVEALEKLKKFNTSELEEFFRYCKNLSLDDKYLRFDPALARGLDYYTGLTFEVISLDEDFGSICGGGRYDNLCSMFCNQDFSGVGVAFGFERIMLLLEKMDLSKSITSSEVLVTLFDESSVEDALGIYSMLVDADIPSEIYFEPEKLAKQFKYADKKNINFVIIRGPDEKEKNELTIKRMDNGKQKVVPLGQLVSYIKNYYAAE